MSEEQKSQMNNVPLSNGVVRAAKELQPVHDGLCLRHGLKTMEEAMQVPLTMMISGILLPAPDIRKLIEENKAECTQTATDILQLLHSKNNMVIVDLIALLNSVATVVRHMQKVSDEETATPPDAPIQVIEQ